MGSVTVVAEAPVGAAASLSANTTLWWVDALEPGEPGSTALVEAVVAGLPFDRGVEVVVKPAYGAAGIQAFLNSTARVAPERLPDLAVLPLGALREARTAGLAHAFPEPGDRTERSFAFAATRSWDGELRWALPIAVNLLHTIGREVEPPETWENLEGGAAGAMVIPLGGSSPPDLSPLLSVYAGTGGSLANLPSIDVQALSRSLDRLAAGLAAGRLTLPQNGHSPRSAWNTFASSDPVLSVVDAGSVAANQAGYPGIIWGALPGETGSAPSLAWGWALILVTPSPERQASATRLAGLLAEALSAGPITATGWLPARREGWADTMIVALESPPNPDYLDFLELQLDTASAVDGNAAWRASWGQVGADLAAGISAEQAATRLVTQ